MSHFGRSGPPDISDTYSLLVLNITFRTTADDLYPLFAKYGKVVDIFIPRDRRTGDSRGFAFVRYKHVDEAEKAVQRLDALVDMQISLSKLQPADIVLILSISTGRNVDGRDIVVQFAKYGPNAEAIAKGRVSHESFRQKTSRSRSPRRSRYRDGDDYHRERDYRYRDGRPRERDYRRRSRSRSRSLDRSGRYRDRERDHRRLPSRSLSRSRSRSPSRSRSRSRSSSRDYSRRPRKSRSRSPERKGSSPRERRSVDRRSPSLDRHPSSSPSPRRRSSDKSVSPPPIRSVSPVNHRQRRPSRSPSRDSRSPLSGNSDH